jgi:hypothetical protein
MDAAVAAELVSVYRALDGGVHHACGQRMVPRAGPAEELHFSCPRCTESVTLPPGALTRIPVAT